MFDRMLQRPGVPDQTHIEEESVVTQLQGNSAATPFFIMGCRRTGTTLVSQILDSHSRLASYHESYFYNIFRQELRWYGDLADGRRLRALIDDVREVIRDQGAQPPDAEELLRAIDSPTLESVFASVLRLYANSRGKVRGGDKTPEHHLFLNDILTGLPASPVIFVVRDPRDTAQSIRRTMDVSLEDGAIAWNSALLSLRGARRPVHVVKYEDLVAQPAEQVRAICAHLGEEYQDAMLEFHANVPSRYLNRRGGEKLGRQVDANAVGGYRSHLTAEEIAMVESLCGDGIVEMGYTFEGKRSGGAVSIPQGRAKQTFPRLVRERLLYYGFRRERWRRGMIRWRMMLRARLRYVFAEMRHG